MERQLGATSPCLYKHWWIHTCHIRKERLAKAGKKLHEHIWTPLTVTCEQSSKRQDGLSSIPSKQYEKVHTNVTRIGEDIVDLTVVAGLRKLLGQAILALAEMKSGNYRAFSVQKMELNTLFENII